MTFTERQFFIIYFQITIHISKNTKKKLKPPYFNKNWAIMLHGSLPFVLMVFYFPLSSVLMVFYHPLPSALMVFYHSLPSVIILLNNPGTYSIVANTYLYLPESAACFVQAKSVPCHCTPTTKVWTTAHTVWGPFTPSSSCPVIQFILDNFHFSIFCQAW